MNASVTMRQAGQSKKMAEARLSFEELSITILIQFFSILKMYTHFTDTDRYKDRASSVPTQDIPPFVGWSERNPEKLL
jgi:hypothetical protein